VAFGQDKDIQEYRDMMKIPDRFEDGFGWKTVIGALFLGIFMLPGSMYLSLVMGGGLGSATTQKATAAPRGPISIARGPGRGAASPPRR